MELMIAALVVVEEKVELLASGAVELSVLKGVELLASEAV